MKKHKLLSVCSQWSRNSVGKLLSKFVGFYIQLEPLHQVSCWMIQLVWIYFHIKWTDKQTHCYNVCHIFCNFTANLRACDCKYINPCAEKWLFVSEADWFWLFHDRCPDRRFRYSQSIFSPFCLNSRALTIFNVDLPLPIGCKWQRLTQFYVRFIRFFSTKFMITLLWTQSAWHFLFWFQKDITKQQKVTWVQRMHAICNEISLVAEIFVKQACVNASIHCITG